MMISTVGAGFLYSVISSRVRVFSLSALVDEEGSQNILVSELEFLLELLQFLDNPSVFEFAVGEHGGS